MQRVITRCGLIVLLLTLTGCVEFRDDVVDALACQNCEVNAQVKVSRDREVILFVRHHVYAGGDPALPYDPSQEVLHPVTGSFKTTNEKIVQDRASRIGKYVDETNRIFAQNGVNVYLVNSGGYEVVVDPDMFPGQASIYSPTGHTGDVVAQTRAVSPEFVHVHWTWGSSTILIAVGSGFSVVIMDDPWRGDVVGARTFAHEVFHALGYEQHENSDPTNLMRATGGGESLNQDQIEIVWNALNTRSSAEALTSLTCDVKRNKCPPEAE